MERKLVVGTASWAAVLEQFSCGLSPEQAARTLKRMHPEIPALHFSHETIYQAIYAMPRGDLRAEVIALLRFGHARRRPRTRGQDRRGQISCTSGSHVCPAAASEEEIQGQ